MNDGMRVAPVSAGDPVEGTEFGNLAVTTGFNEILQMKVIIVALFDGDGSPDEDAAYFPIESKAQAQAIIESLKNAMDAAFHDD